MVNDFYFAGIIDQGSSIAIKRRADGRFLPEIVVTRKGGTIVKKFLDRFEGYLSGHSAVFQGPRAVLLATALVGLVDDKKRHLELIIEFGQLPSPSGKRFSAEDIAQREAMVVELKGLNNRSREAVPFQVKKHEKVIEVPKEETPQSSTSTIDRVKLPWKPTRERDAQYYIDRGRPVPPEYLGQTSSPYKMDEVGLTAQAKAPRETMEVMKFPLTQAEAFPATGDGPTDDEAPDDLPFS